MDEAPSPRRRRSLHYPPKRPRAKRDQQKTMDAPIQSSGVAIVREKARSEVSVAFGTRTTRTKPRIAVLEEAARMQQDLEVSRFNDVLRQRAPVASSDEVLAKLRNPRKEQELREWKEKRDRARRHVVRRGVKFDVGRAVKPREYNEYAASTLTGHDWYEAPATVAVAETAGEMMVAQPDPSRVLASLPSPPRPPHHAERNFAPVQHEPSARLLEFKKKRRDAKQAAGRRGRARPLSPVDSTAVERGVKLGVGELTNKAPQRVMKAPPRKQRQREPRDPRRDHHGAKRQGASMGGKGRRQPQPELRHSPRVETRADEGDAAAGRFTGGGYRSEPRLLADDDTAMAGWGDDEKKDFPQGRVSEPYGIPAKRRAKARTRTVRVAVLSEATIADDAKMTGVAVAAAPSPVMSVSSTESAAIWELERKILGCIGRREVFMQQMLDLSSELDGDYGGGDAREASSSRVSGAKKAKRRFRSVLAAYRIATLDVVFAILEWRDGLSQAPSDTKARSWRPFIWKERNYLTTMQHDMAWVATNVAVAEQVGGRHAAKSAPFFLAHIHGNNSARSNAAMLSTSGNSRYRITKDDLPRFAMAERIVAEEAGRENAANFLLLDEDGGGSGSSDECGVEGDADDLAKDEIDDEHPSPLPPSFMLSPQSHSFRRSVLRSPPVIHERGEYDLDGSDTALHASPAKIVTFDNSAVDEAPLHSPDATVAEQSGDGTTTAEESVSSSRARSMMALEANRRKREEEFGQQVLAANERRLVEREREVRREAMAKEIESLRLELRVSAASSLQRVYRGHAGRLRFEQERPLLEALHHDRQMQRENNLGSPPSAVPGESDEGVSGAESVPSRGQVDAREAAAGLLQRHYRGYAGRSEAREAQWKRCRAKEAIIAEELIAASVRSAVDARISPREPPLSDVTREDAKIGDTAGATALPTTAADPAVTSVAPTVSSVAATASSVSIAAVDAALEHFT